MNRRKALMRMMQVSALLSSHHLFSKNLTFSERVKFFKGWAWASPSDKRNKEDWKRQLSLAKEAGINGLVLQVYNGNKTFFENDKIPYQNNSVNEIFALAKAFEMETHAWLITMICTNKDIVEKYPEWYAVNGLSQSSVEHPAYVDYYKFLCARHPGVKEYLSTVVSEIAKLENLDGVHLDYIRYPDVIIAEALQPKYDIVQDKEFPEYDYCYSAHCRNIFQEKHGYDPLSIEDPSKDKKWVQFRRDAVTELVNNTLIPIIKANNKASSAALFPNWESVRQEWGKWNLDMFFPMLYHNFYYGDIEWIKKFTTYSQNFVENKRPVYSGLFVPSLSGEELVQAIEGVKNIGGNGFCLFNLWSMKEAHWTSMKNVRHLMKY